MNLEKIYAHHPLTERAIRTRLDRQRIHPDTVTEWHLALDPELELTDQNHPGGVQAVLELAVAARITSTSLVVDVGAGLGGSMRVLAEALGCRAIGVERDASRHRDAVTLTALVRLDHLVEIRQRDALLSRDRIDRMDVLWGQAAWVHFPDPRRFLDLWLPAVSPHGCVAMADIFLRRTPATADERTLIADLEDIWGAHLLPLSAWTDPLGDHEFATSYLQECTHDTVASFLRLTAAASRWADGTVTEDERRGWRCALDGFSAGLLVAYQLVAIRKG